MEISEKNNNAGQNSVTFSKLALALANDYESIYVIDSKNDSYVEYSASGECKELSVVSRGDDFFTDLVKNTELLVYPDDRAFFLKSLNKANVSEKLKNGGSFSIEYRLIKNGAPCYYFLKTIRAAEGSTIIGVRNIDAQKKLELAFSETSQTYSDIAESLANLFEVIYHIDIATGHYTEYSSSESFSKLGLDRGGENFFEKVAVDIRTVIHPDDCERVIGIFQKETLLERLNNKGSVSVVYRQMLDGKVQYLKLVAFRNQKDAKRIVIGVRNIDKQKRLESESETYEQIAGALASRYEAIYYINVNTNEYTMYSSSEIYSELGLTKQGADFFADAEVDIKTFIHPDDVTKVLTEMNKESLLRNLDVTGTLSLNYRQKLGDNVLYVNNLVVRPENDRDHIVMGVTNIDAQVRRESAGETYGQIAGALASRYEAIYYINTENNEYSMYSSSEIYAKLGLTKQGSDFFADAVDDIKVFIHADDRERVLGEMNKEHLLENLEETGSLSFNYRQQLDGRTQYVNMLVVRPKNDRQHIVMGVTNIDAQMRRELSMEEESRTFNEIAKALAQRYEVIYHVDLITNKYREYSASESYTKLKIGNVGSDFFAETQANLKRDIFPEDQALVSFSMQKENLIDSLRETGKYSLNYRLMLDGKVQYVMLFAVRPKEDSTHIIVAVANVDAAKRKELEFEEAIGSAIDMANRDALTGIFNKRAYAQIEMEIDERIENGEASDFCVVVCDINGLKQINDNKGHNSGDDFIRSACELISDTFCGSVVYRIGGDEFVVILKDGDFDKRDELIAEFGRRQEEQMRNGLVTVAFGYSDFDRNSDIRLQDVFERADNAMYENKELIKKGTANEKDLIVSFAENETDKRFNDLFAQLISAMTNMDHIDVPLIENLLIDISLLLRLSKGVTRLYRNPTEEKEGGGETLCCFDTGVEGKVVKAMRVVTSVMSIATLTIYMSDDEEPLTAKEEQRLDLVMRALLSFVSRNRLRDIVEELSFFDDSRYPNQRKLRSYLDNVDLRGKALISYNLRHFSLVNQEIGRYAGDIVMRNHFNTLTDMIGGNGLVCRLGGDNFVAVCGAEQVEYITEFLFESPVIYDPAERRSVNISASAGVYIVPVDSEYGDPAEFMTKIMICLRAAQSGGKEHIIYFDNALLMKKEKSMRVQQLFPEALRNEEFHVFYQPKVNILTGNLSGAEALCRWFRNGNIVPPIDFIPMLEETNDICKLDFYMLDHVCADIRRLLDEGREPVRISVNLSRKHMMDTGLTDTITEIIDKHGIPHDYIEIELTETTSDVEFSDLKRVVSGLQNAGVCTVVDDFGIGYSSLNLIRALPWNGLKVDRSFLPVDEDNSNSSRSIMFKHVVAMAKEMGLECVAEGVETVLQLNIMKELGCDFAQGFLFDRPMPYEEFLKRLEKSTYSLEF